MMFGEEDTLRAWLEVERRRYRSQERSSGAVRDKKELDSKHVLDVKLQNVDPRTKTIHCYCIHAFQLTVEGGWRCIIPHVGK